MKLVKLFLLFFITSSTACASQGSEIHTILAQEDAPLGIVFEVVSAFEGTLQSAIPKIIKYSTQLRQKFPNINIAVVTHGNEQFALITKNESEYKKVHKQVKLLVEKEDIPIHICATYADRKGVAENEFPDYINVAASGPSQISNYRELGYIVIKISNW